MSDAGQGLGKVSFAAYCERRFESSFLLDERAEMIDNWCMDSILTRWKSGVQIPYAPQGLTELSTGARQGVRQGFIGVLHA